MIKIGVNLRKLSQKIKLGYRFFDHPVDVDADIRRRQRLTAVTHTLKRNSYKKLVIGSYVLLGANFWYSFFSTCVIARRPTGFQRSSKGKGKGTVSR